METLFWFGFWATASAVTGISGALFNHQHHQRRHQHQHHVHGHHRHPPHHHVHRRTVNCDSRSFTQKLDHFSSVSNTTFQERYVVCSEHWKPGGPILFYTGNEGDIMMFVNNTGFMYDLAPQVNGMVVFAEHRYYGTSVPYDGTLNGTTMAYLNSAQALADYNDLIYSLKSNISGAAQSPVIAFGGSYGGMLAAWMRMKYPTTIIGALSSSAPTLQVGDAIPCNTFSQITTRAYKLASPVCVSAIRESWRALERLWKNAKGREWIKSTFHLCGKTHNDKVKVDDVKGWLTAGWTYMAMTNYPYPTNFLKPMPGWPVKAACEFLKDQQILKDDKILLKSIYQAVSVYYNYTGQQTTCFNLTDSSSGTALGDVQWDYQACSEMVIPDCSDGKTDMFYPRPWNLTDYTQNCLKTFGVRPDLQMALKEYGGSDLRFYSNIIFSNGDLDPWSGGGVLNTTNPTLTVLYIKDAAHHLDLRAASPQDPQPVIDARTKEVEVIKGWINQHRRRTKGKHEL